MSEQQEELTRLTVNLIPKADAALELAARVTGLSRTDTVNRALQFYAYMMAVKDNGGEVLIRERKDWKLQRLVLR